MTGLFLLHKHLLPYIRYISVFRIKTTWEVAALNLKPIPLMKRLILSLVITSLFLFHLNAQNLIPNPSFENITNPFCGIMNTSDFTATILDWTSPTDGTPDAYFTNVETSCYNFQPFSEYDGPIGIKGNQTPFSGTTMLGCGLFSIDGLNQREYVQTQLTAPLTIGQTYELNFQVSLADFTEFYLGEIGIHFSTNQLSGNGSAPLNVSPQIIAETGLENYQDWVAVSTTFTPTENYEFMTIGNFNNDANTTLFPNPNASGEAGTYGAYYFFDDFSLIDTNPVGINNFETAGIQFFPNPVDESIQLTLPNSMNQVKVNISNMHGRNIYTQQFTSESIININTANLPTGTYLILIEDGADVLVERFMKI